MSVVAPCFCCGCAGDMHRPASRGNPSPCSTEGCLCPSYMTRGGVAPCVHTDARPLICGEGNFVASWCPSCGALNETCYFEDWESPAQAIQIVVGKPRAPFIPIELHPVRMPGCGCAVCKLADVVAAESFARSG